MATDNAISCSIEAEQHDNLEAEVLDVPIAIADWLRACRDMKNGKFVGCASVLWRAAEKAMLELEDATKKLCASADQQTIAFMNRRAA